MSKIYINESGKKFMFFTNYKVMNSIAGKLLRENFPDIKVFITPEKILHFDNHLKIAIVRNPYDRLVSLYFDKCRINPEDLRKRKENLFLQVNQAQLLAAYCKKENLVMEISEPGKTVEIKDDSYRILLKNLEVLEALTFHEFIELVALLFSEPSMDAHFIPQSTIMTKNDTLLIDRYFKLEQIDETWSDICELLGKEIPLYWGRGANQTNFEGPERYKRFYSNTLKETVYNLYKIDFDNFSYDKEF